MPSGDPLAPLNSLNAVQWRASVLLHQTNFFIFDFFFPLSILFLAFLSSNVFSSPGRRRRKDDGAVEHVLIRWKPRDSINSSRVARVSKRWLFNRVLVDSLESRFG